MIQKDTKAAFRAAFPHTIPVMTAFLFLGIAYGMMMNDRGFSFIYPLMTGIIIYGGSLEFLSASLLLSPFNPFAAFLLGLMIQARHLFYGLAMLDRFENLGKIKWYIIYTMGDETFSLLYSVPVPLGIRKDLFYFAIAFLHQVYWITGTVTGALLGEVLKINMEGIGFVMTAMFVVIFMNQLEKEKDHTPAWIGFGLALLSLVLFGSANFIIPAMVGIILLLGIYRLRSKEAL